jgi:hypothetical protein
MREQIMKGVSQWIDLKVDELAVDNIWLALGGNTIKRVLVNLIDDNLPMGIIKPLLSNHGALDAKLLADELNTALRNMPQTKLPITDSMYAVIGEGNISIYLPSNGFIDTVMKGVSVIHFRESDINELAQLINESNV